MVVRERGPADADWIRALLQDRWGGSTMVIDGEAIDLLAQPALIAGEREGLATYRIAGREAELLSLDAVRPGIGVGTALLTALADRLRRRGVTRLRVTTTNDNLAALRFYQRRGFRMSRLRPGAVDEARRLKPSIPPTGYDGIPIRDEIDLSLELADTRPTATP